MSLNGRAHPMNETTYISTSAYESGMDNLFKKDYPWSD
jgi:hypothetical protein